MEAFGRETGVDPNIVKQHHQKGLTPLTALPRKARLASAFKRRVNGWEWDSHLAGYVATGANKFACDCGEEFTPPKYHKCECGKTHNAYVIGTGGDRHEAAIEKFICREIPERSGMLVASRRYAAVHSPLSGKASCHECWGNSAERGGSDQPYLDLLKQNHHEELTKHFHKDRYLEQQRHPETVGPKHGPGRYRAANSTGPENPEWWAKQHNPTVPSPEPVSPVVSQQKPETQHMQYKRLQAGYSDEHPEEFPYKHLKPGEDPFPGRPKFPRRKFDEDHLDHGQDVEPLYHVDHYGAQGN